MRRRLSITFLAGCAAITVAGCGPRSGSATLVQQVLRVTGLHWRLNR